MTEVPGPTLPWQVATVESVTHASKRVKLFRLKLDEWLGFRAGQHFDVRLTAPDGYQAQRSYSISSNPEDSGILEFAIELIDDGEVSSYFHEAVEPGEKIELRGPIGGHFTWNKQLLRPVVCVAGGSGIAPIMSMLRQRAAQEYRSPTLLLFSVRSQDDILFRQELEQMADDDPGFKLLITLTRENSPTWNGSTHRISQSTIDEVFAVSGILPERAYVCGGSTFVESMANFLLESGMNFNEIRTERFGP